MSAKVSGEEKEMEKLERAAEDAREPEEIHRAANGPGEAPERPHRFWFVPYLVVAVVAGAGSFILDWQTFFRSSVAEKVQRYLLGVAGVAVALVLMRSVEVYAISRIRNRVSRFNLKRILRLAMVVTVAFIVVSVLFVNWYAAVVSLGLISLILGFALQTPISSFIGWVYILMRAPYRVGDRIQIGDARGDVIDVSYLDTTLWETGGPMLSSDHPSGRLIKFPNTNVFNTPVYNYSWPLFPYVWNEVKFQIAYESDLDWVAETMQKLTEEEIGETMMDKVVIYRDLLARTPVNHLEVQERPVVFFRVHDNTWLEAIVRYLVHPKEAGRVKAKITRKLLRALNAEPDRVLFPKSNAR